MKNLPPLKRSLIALLLASVLPTIVFSETPQDRVVLEMTETYEKMKNIEADFTQTVDFADFDTQATSTGKVFLKKGKMRWDYFTPTPQQIFIDGNRLLQYVPQHQQVLRSQISQRTGLPIDLFMGIGKIGELFKISKTGERELLLIPKEPGSSTTKISLILTRPPTGRGLLIQQVVLHERNGNRSTFLLSHFQMNKTVSEDIFLLNVPEGVEVIDTP